MKAAVAEEKEKMKAAVAEEKEKMILMFFQNGTPINIIAISLNMKAVDIQKIIDKHKK